MSVITNGSKADRVAALRALVRRGGAGCAPMAGVTDRPFRRLCRRMGAIYVTTEFLPGEGLRRGIARVMRMAAYSDEERPLGMQLYGADPEAMAAGARAAAALGPDFIDINFGCPVKKVVRSQGGSGCMRDMALMERIARAVDAAVELPVTLKMRAGWDEHSLNAPEVARMAQDLGLAFVAVHGRTRQQMYRGEADLGVIRRVKEAVSIPVIGNGDVVDGDSYARMVGETGVDAVLIGRGCIGNPWIFAEIEARRQGLPWRPPALRERLDLMLEELEASVAERGERKGVRDFRRQMGPYLRGLPGAAALRKELFTHERVESVRELVLDYARVHTA